MENGPIERRYNHARLSEKEHYDSGYVKPRRSEVAGGAFVFGPSGQRKIALQTALWPDTRYLAATILPHSRHQNSHGSWLQKKPR
jgi:hypothetical protein